MVLSHLFDHTNGVNPSTTPGYSIRLNGSDNERNGIARSLSVMPGDKIDMQVFGKYYDPNTPQANQTAWDNLVGLITQVTNAAQTVVVDGVGYTSGALRVPPATGVLTDPNENVAYPKAHLNWATFDRDWKFLDGGAKQLQGGAEDGTDVPFAEISKSIEIKEPGYVYIWLSNTSAQQRDVFFDLAVIKNAMKQEGVSEGMADALKSLAGAYETSLNELSTLEKSDQVYYVFKAPEAKVV